MSVGDTRACRSCQLPLSKVRHVTGLGELVPAYHGICHASYINGPSNLNDRGFMEKSGSGRRPRDLVWTSCCLESLPEKSMASVGVVPACLVLLPRPSHRGSFPRVSSNQISQIRQEHKETVEYHLAGGLLERLEGLAVVSWNDTREVRVVSRRSKMMKRREPLLGARGVNGPVL